MKRFFSIIFCFLAVFLILFSYSGCKTNSIESDEIQEEQQDDSVPDDTTDDNEFNESEAPIESDSFPE